MDPVTITIVGMVGGLVAFGIYALYQYATFRTVVKHAEKGMEEGNKMLVDFRSSVDKEREKNDQILMEMLKYARDIEKERKDEKEKMLAKLSDSLVSKEEKDTIKKELQKEQDLDEKITACQSVIEDNRKKLSEIENIIQLAQQEKQKEIKDLDAQIKAITENIDSLKKQKSLFNRSTINPKIDQQQKNLKLLSDQLTQSQIQIFEQNYTVKIKDNAGIITSVNMQEYINKKNGFESQIRDKTLDLNSLVKSKDRKSPSENLFDEVKKRWEKSNGKLDERQSKLDNLQAQMAADVQTRSASFGKQLYQTSTNAISSAFNKLLNLFSNNKSKNPLGNETEKDIRMENQDHKQVGSTEADIGRTRAPSRPT